MPAYSETPPFETAIDDFRKFITEYGWSSNLAWVFREDVTNCRRDYWVRMPIPSENAAIAEAYYDLGRRRGLGVSLTAVLKLGDLSVAYVDVPEDEVAANQMMMAPLKLSFSADTYVVRPVRSLWAWNWRVWRNRQLGCNALSVSLPSRTEVIGIQSRLEALPPR